MSELDLQNRSPLPGDLLRDEAGNLLSGRYGNPIVEHRVRGKKTDIFFRFDELGKERRLYVEAKDYEKRLTRKDVVSIWSDYSGILLTNQPSDLLLVTKSGLTADAQAYVEEQYNFRHQTIWELESSVLGLTPYIRSLTSLFDQDGLSGYYIPARARAAKYMEGTQSRLSSDHDVAFFSHVDDWIAKAGSALPIAVLGGYGAGKSSFAKLIVSHYAKLALSNPLSRRPILVKLGQFSRYSSLEGILGGMFSSEFPINGYNFHEFMSANERGRLIVVLDGFDEMKHAMTWTDFRSQLAELNRLCSSSSRVLLLGRPNAFLTHDEHIHALRGRKRSGDNWRRLKDWPQFSEFDLQDFNEDERSTFVQKYLHFSSSGLSTGELDERAMKLKELTSLAPEIFSKPVHAKILTDLAADPEFKLDRFKKHVTRWKLYEAFFDTLAERESEKESRRPISEVKRLEFLRRLAIWLWSDKAGSVSFSAADVPVSVISTVEAPDSSDDESKLRELLTGSLLEKKGRDIYFFGHRSFAEFLIAQHMFLTSPKAQDHALYSYLWRDGVETFFDEITDRRLFVEWARTVSYARGKIRFQYFERLIKKVGGLRYFSGQMEGRSIWYAYFKPFSQTVEFNSAVDSKIIMNISKSDNALAALYIKTLSYSRSIYGKDTLGIDGANMCALAAHLLKRPMTRFRDDFGLFKNRPDLGVSSYLTKDVFLRDRGVREISMDFEKLVRNASDLLESVDVDIDFDISSSELITSEKLLMDVDRVTGSLSLIKRSNLREAITYMKAVPHLLGMRV